LATHRARLIFDSYYDRYRGAIPASRVDGTIRPGMKIAFGAPGRLYEVDEVGYYSSAQGDRAPE